MNQKHDPAKWTNKPKLDRFENTEPRVLYKEYNAMRGIDGILYQKFMNGSSRYHSNMLI